MASSSSNWSLFEKRYSQIIPEFELFLEALENPFPIGLRENPLHSLPYRLEGKLKKQSLYGYKRPYEGLDYFEVEGPRKAWGGDLDHHLGLYFMQALSSLFPALILDPLEGQAVFDMCAAPGGKTTHLAGLMNNCGLLVACEPDINRSRVLKANLSRFGVLNTSFFLGKGQDIEFPRESFDRILLDGPCSSEGTFRSDVISGSKRRAVNYLEYNERFRKSLHEEQQALLRKSYELLKPEGTLVYSTCTYDPQENEGQVSRFLADHPQMKLEPISLPFDLNTSPGLTEFAGESFHPDCRECWRFYPHQINSIGFFIAKLTKRP